MVLPRASWRPTSRSTRRILGLSLRSSPAVRGLARALGTCPQQRSFWESSLNGYLVALLIGVLVAFLSFLLKEAVVWLDRGFKLRRRLVADLQMSVDNYHSHHSSLSGIANQISKSWPTPSFIWDTTTNSEDLLLSVAEHISATEVALCTHFYDELSLISEIREEYNSAVRGLILDGEKSEEYMSLLKACLADLQTEYRDLIATGCSCLIILANNHWCLRIPIEPYQKIKDEYTKETGA